MNFIKLFSSITLILQYLLLDYSLPAQKELIQAFFLYDFLYMLFNIDLKKVVYRVLIFHHISIIYSINYDFKGRYIWPYYIFLGELSNIPMMVYYLLLNENYKNKYILLLLNFIELISYISIRFLLFSYNFYIGQYVEFGYSLYYCVIPLYFMGVIWSYELIRGFIKNMKETLF
tara:strand:+ start:377 stop:898 length:522 start_codon:yes stop_codon:yes gene_type:complete